MRRKLQGDLWEGYLVEDGREVDYDDHFCTVDCNCVHLCSGACGAITES